MYVHTPHIVSAVCADTPEIIQCTYIHFIFKMYIHFVFKMYIHFIFDVYIHPTDEVYIHPPECLPCIYTPECLRCIYTPECMHIHIYIYIYIYMRCTYTLGCMRGCRAACLLCFSANVWSASAYRSKNRVCGVCSAKCSSSFAAAD